MIDPLREAKRLEHLAETEPSLERAQKLALEADRLRRSAGGNRFFSLAVLPLLRS